MFVYITILLKVKMIFCTKRYLFYVCLRLCMCMSLQEPTLVRKMLTTLKLELYMAVSCSVGAQTGINNNKYSKLQSHLFSPKMNFLMLAFIFELCS